MKDRPKAIGFIDTVERTETDKEGKKIHFNTGAVLFTDDRLYKFWYHNREAII